MELGQDAVDIPTLRELGTAPWWREPDLEETQRLATESRALVERAFGDEDPDAQRQLELALYELNLDSRFAVPSSPALAIVWSTLMQAKLAYHRREFGISLKGANSPEALSRTLVEMVARWGAHRHPVLAELDRDGTIGTYQIWAKNWFGSCYGFSLQLASLVQRTTGVVKKTVLENLNDEFDEKVTHDSLRVRFFSGLGLRHSPREAVYEKEWVTESSALLNLRTGLSNLASPLWALGAFFTIEANWPTECRCHHAMNKARGLDDETLEYWTTHAFADEHHSSEWLEAVRAMCKNDADRTAVLEGAMIQLRLRWRMYDAIQAALSESRDR